MKKHAAQETGRQGEELAASYLRNKGYEVVQQNFRFRRAEIDLIARKREMLVFVEVKTRQSTDFGFPETFVSPAQAALIVEAADHYVQEHDWPGLIRFDIIAITQVPTLEISHFEDAFY